MAPIFGPLRKKMFFLKRVDGRIHVPRNW